MLLTPPRRLDEAGFERLLSAAAGSAPQGVDLGGVSFIDPYGITTLLSIGASNEYRRRQTWGLRLPRDGRVMDFLERSGGLKWLEKNFIVDGGPGDGACEERTKGSTDPPLLEVTPVSDMADVHRSVARVKGRVDQLLVGRLGYNMLAADRFTVAVAEICQNIVEHSESKGFVAAHYYRPARGRAMVRLAVTDTGIGIRSSLAPRYASHNSPWTDRTAVRLAFKRWISRFEESGRGLGLKLVAEMVRGWGGRLLLRSGTAAFAICPTWGPRPRRSGLAPFPGTQVNIFLPAEAS